VDSIPIEQPSWHDNSVHGLVLSDFDPAEGTGTLTLDVDHIQEWIPSAGRYKFRITPALLRFRGVFGLRISLDYSVGPIAVTPFQIDSIEREVISEPYGSSMRWRIPIACPKGEIAFTARDWDLEFTGEMVESDTQTLARDSTLLPESGRARKSPYGR
jgi:hypothetical protein